jgi:nickel transport system ATP-binding protein
MNLLEVKNLVISDCKKGHNIIKGISFCLSPDKCLAIVGESGSGKSVSCKAIMKLNSANLISRGNVIFNGKDLLDNSSAEMKTLRGKSISMIMQNGMGAFDPSCIIGTFIHEILNEHFGYDKKTAYKVIGEYMETLMLNADNVLGKYPHQLSGGMLQKTMIAISIALKPDIIIADEPTTALDTVVQFNVIEQFIKIRREFGTAMLFISHDLGVIKKLADDIIVMKDGVIVEYGSSADIFLNPQNEYTKYLVTSRLALGKKFNAVMKRGD